MELVYLWVEKYKNIEKQGFNFSSRFECEFKDKDGKEKLKDDCQLVIKPKEHIENFFGNKINVTAIVGENGSGKSSVFEALSLLYYNHYGDVLKSENKIFIVFKIKNDFYIMSTKDNGCAYATEANKDDEKYIIQVDLNKATDNLSGKRHYLTYFSNCLTDMTKQKRFEPFKDKNEGARSYFYNGLQPKDLGKQQYTPLNNKNDTYDYFNLKYADILKDNDSFFSFIDEKLTFDSYKFEIHISDLGVYFAHERLYKDLIELESDNLFLEINSDNSKSYFYKFMALYIIKESIDIISRKTDDEYRFKGATSDYIDKAIMKFIELVKEKFKEDCSKKDYYENILKICSEYIDKDTFSIKNIDKLLQDYTYISKNIWKSTNFNIKDNHINHYLDNKILTKLEQDNIFRVDFFKENNEEYNFLSLSSGEQEYLKILTNFSYTMKHYVEGQNNIILFDEIELSMHPNWQKKLINNLDIILKSFKKKNTYTNIIITSHSPFILSDLPKENVIFLDKLDDKTQEKYPNLVIGDLKKGNCINVSKHINISPFGANIHTLLAHGFFMEDGLMGEFAKSKINEVIDNLQEKSQSLSQKQIKSIVATIGEPFLQTKLEQMYNEKFDLDDELEELQKQQEKINLKIEQLKKQKSENVKS